MLNTVVLLTLSALWKTNFKSAFVFIMQIPVKIITMKYTFAFSLVCVIFFGTIPWSVCEDWFAYEQQEYHFAYAAAKDIEIASTECGNRGASLVLIKSQAVQTFLTNVSDENRVSSLSIGLKKVNDEEEGFVWEDGVPLADAGYTNWKPQQPDNGNGPDKKWCVQMTSSFPGLWDTVSCSTPGAYICQRSIRNSSSTTIPAVTETSTIKQKNFALFAATTIWNDDQFSTESNTDTTTQSFSELSVLDETTTDQEIDTDTTTQSFSESSVLDETTTDQEIDTDTTTQSFSESSVFVETTTNQEIDTDTTTQSFSESSVFVETTTNQEIDTDTTTQSFSESSVFVETTTDQEIDTDTTQSFSESSVFVTTSTNQEIDTSHFTATTSTVQEIVPEEPVFNCTPSLTSLRFDWSPVEAHYYLFESDPIGMLTTVRVELSLTTYTNFNVTPYTEYTVLMYSAITSSNGKEIRSTATPQKCTTYAEEFCPESTLPHIIDNNTVTFPSTLAGYTNSSIEVCDVESGNDGVPLGTRACSIEGNWLEPVWFSSCDVSLEDLVSQNVTTEEERNEIASDLVILTSDPSSLTSDDLQNSVTAVESIVSAEELDQSTSSLVVESIGNLLAAPEEELESSNISENLLLSLDQVASKVIVEEGGVYQTVTSALALAVVETNQRASQDGAGFEMRANPTTEQLGFSSGQFEIILDYNSTSSKNSSLIFLPNKAIDQEPDDRVSFYAFLDDNVFQVSNISHPESDGNTLPHDANVLSGVVLSASIVGRSMTNLKENVTMLFEIDKAVCSSTSSDGVVDCGKKFCGFWNESSMLWSNVGCMLTRMTEETIECQCNHLTNFAALFAQGDSSGIRNNVALDIVTLVGCSISVLGILCTLIALIVVWSSRKLTMQRRTLFLMLNLSLALLILNGFLLISLFPELTSNEDFCTALAVILHFSLISSLSWMMLEAVYLLIGTTKPIYFRTELTNKKVYIPSILWGWGFPAAFVGITAGVDISIYQKAESDTSNTCWIDSDMMLYLVIIPASVILAFNLISYIIVVRIFTKRKFGRKERNSTSGKTILSSLTLFCIFGISWIFGFLIFDSSTASLVFSYIFAVTTSLQGIFLFLLFVVRNKEIKNSLVYEMKRLHSRVFEKDKLATSNATVMEMNTTSSATNASPL